MARIRDQQAFDASRTNLLKIGESLFRKGSYSEVGIKDILRDAGVPRGSFYHYFDSKESFGIAVAEHYHQGQMTYARETLRAEDQPALDRLRNFFNGALGDMRGRSFEQGCLMCNLTTELADENEAMQSVLARQWQELSNEIARCLAEVDLNAIGLGHLSSPEAADWLLNAWSGALTRMKANGNDQPLTLFLKTVFRHEG